MNNRVAPRQLMHAADPTVSRARRGLDVVVAVIALLISTPVLLVAGLAIRRTSPGPVLFRQTRVGLRGKPFTILKLRTMTVDAPGLDITMRGDPRVTRVGEVLRRTSLDELPQLLNVLRGEMTLVGPRPETVELAGRYPADCRWVLQHTPGLTGPAQVRLRDARVLEPGHALPGSAVGSAGGSEVGAAVLAESSPDPERWYLEQVVPRRVSLDASYLNAPSLSRTVAVLVETAVYLLRGP